MNIQPDLNMSPGFHYTKRRTSNTVHICSACVKIYQSIPDTILNLPNDNFKSKPNNFIFENLY